jgi:hypothetical protein
MTRATTLGFGVALVLLAVGVLTPSSPVAVLMVILAGITFTVIVFVIFGSAWRTKEWSLRHPGRRP